MTPTFDHIGKNVADFPRSLAFYKAALVPLGHTVIGCGRDAGAIEVLRAALGAPHDFEAVDVAREDRVKAWAGRFLAASGAPDLLINNAALINRNAPTWEVPAEEFDRLIDVNIKGVANVLRHVVPGQ